LTNVSFVSVKKCKFEAAQATSAAFGDADGCQFVKANLTKASFQGTIANADFTAAVLEEASFSNYLYGGSGAQQLNQPGCAFTQTSLRKARFENVSLVAPDFDGADASEASFGQCTFDAPSFRKATLRGAAFVGCGLAKANFSDATCGHATFAETDLTDARFDSADLGNVVLNGCKTQGIDFSKAKHYDPNAASTGTVGPALTELDSLSQKAKRIRLTFFVRTKPDEEGDEVGVDTTGLRYGWGLHLPHNLMRTRIPRQTNRSFSDAMLLLASLLANRRVRYETVEVESTKSPKGGKELRDVALSAIAEAFGQPLPAAEELATATKSYRDKIRDAGADARKQREEYKRRQEELKKRETKKIEKTIAKQVGKITDIATFLKALELRADKAKISKATSMLKAEKFQLFNDITDAHLNGVIKSQTDPDLVYACRIESDGKYACCTQNLNICGGLRGSICKHLLVLIIGLVKAEKLDPTTIDEWVAKTRDNKPELNKETMGEIFIRYKGAEAGEVDWRPTETVPEDYYAV
jgi:uncharacterized protein YjbI with pentapeptide repeats